MEKTLTNDNTDYLKQPLRLGVHGGANRGAPAAVQTEGSLASLLARGQIPTPWQARQDPKRQDDKIFWMSVGARRTRTSGQQHLLRAGDAIPRAACAAL